MKKLGSVTRGRNQVSTNDQVQIEIQISLQALNSYPDRFAMNPRISFEEHCYNIMQVAQGERRDGF